MTLPERRIGSFLADALGKSIMGVDTGVGIT